MARHFYERPDLVEDVKSRVDLPDGFWDSEKGRAIKCLEDHVS
jgi:hypothetical protein